MCPCASVQPGLTMQCNQWNRKPTRKHEELFQSVQGLRAKCVCIGRILGMWSGSSEWLNVEDDEVMKAQAMGLNIVKSLSSVIFVKGNYAWKVETVLWHTVAGLSPTTFIMNSLVYALTINRCPCIMWIRDKAVANFFLAQTVYSCSLSESHARQRQVL